MSGESELMKIKMMYLSGLNNADENGCKGCPWYDLNDWKEKFNEKLKEI